MLPATTPSTELCSSILVVTTLERAVTLDTCLICLMSWVGTLSAAPVPRHTKERFVQGLQPFNVRIQRARDGTFGSKVQYSHFLIELFRQEVDVILKVFSRHKHVVNGEDAKLF